MKANIPKSWNSLPKKEKEAISDWLQKITKEQCEKDMRIVLDRYIKMVCLTLHDAFGFGEKRLMMFLGNHKRLFHRQHKMVKDGSQIEYLVIYDEPKELKEFEGLRKTKFGYEPIKLTRPPQSWCYVEEVRQ